MTPQQFTRRTFIFGGPLFDASAGRLVDGRMLVVEGERIAAVDDVGSLPADNGHDRRIDVRGGAILPGLIDCHFHLISRSARVVTDDLVAQSTIEGIQVARQTLQVGVTTVRDAGTKHLGIFALQRAIDSGEIPGPRSFVTGPNPTGTGAPATWRNVFVDGPLEMRRAIRAQWEAGAQWIKLIMSHGTEESNLATIAEYVSDDELAAAVEECRTKGMPLSCHCEGVPAARRAVMAGMDGLDHGIGLDEPLVDEMARRGTYYIPNLWSFSVATRRQWGQIRPGAEAAYEAREAEHRLAFQRAMQGGVLIGAGSDTAEIIASPDVLVCEMELMADAGMSKPEVLRAATINAARIVRAESSLGSLEPGKLADVVDFDGNPEDVLRALTRTRLVM
jgi:imidazolonepropionase-like amidohydrolase